MDSKLIALFEEYGMDSTNITKESLALLKKRLVAEEEKASVELAEHNKRMNELKAGDYSNHIELINGIASKDISDATKNALKSVNKITKLQQSIKNDPSYRQELAIKIANKMTTEYYMVSIDVSDNSNLILTYTVKTPKAEPVVQLHNNMEDMLFGLALKYRIK